MGMKTLEIAVGACRVVPEMLTRASDNGESSSKNESGLDLAAILNRYKIAVYIFKSDDQCII